MAQITGSDGIDELFGTDGDDEIHGLGGNDILRGRAGNDVLRGGIGNDRMIGWLGDDVYYVEGRGDRVVERFDHGIDTVIATGGYVLGRFVENLTLTAGARVGTGNDLDNVIDASSQSAFRDPRYGPYDYGINNFIDGGAGADLMIGGYGRDVYYVDNVGDVIREIGEIVNPQNPRDFDSMNALDNLNYDTVFSAIDYDLRGDRDPGAGVAYLEDLTLTGTAINGTGNEFQNIITGNDEDNVLMGLGGNDLLIGGDGDDVLIGGEGRDVLNGGLGDDVLSGERFIFDNLESVDRLQGFSSSPRIFIDPNVFTEAQFDSGGFLLQSNFRIGGNAVNSNQHFVYNENRGEIYYDADGDGPVEKILFATVDPMTEIRFSSFVAYFY
jgi:Ca2+-binding RTX toxin-like protein